MRDILALPYDSLFPSCTMCSRELIPDIMALLSNRILFEIVKVIMSVNNIVLEDYWNFNNFVILHNIKMLLVKPEFSWSGCRLRNVMKLNVNFFLDPAAVKSTNAFREISIGAQPSHEIIDLTKVNMNHDGLQPRKAFRSSFTLERYITRFLAAFYYPPLLYHGVEEVQVCARDLSMVQRIRDLSWWISLDFLVPVSLICVISPRSPVTNVFPLYHIVLPYIFTIEKMQVKQLIFERFIHSTKSSHINRMKILVFATCILAAVVSTNNYDAMVLDNIINTLMSKAVDLKDLINFHMTFAQCVVKLGLLKIASPEVSFCIAEKKNLLDEEGGIKWDDTLDYLMTIIHDMSKKDRIKEILQKCKEEGDNFEGSKKEKSFKSMECGMAMIKKQVRKARWSRSTLRRKAKPQPLLIRTPDLRRLSDQRSILLVLADQAGGGLAGPQVQRAHVDTRRNRAGILQIRKAVLVLLLDVTLKGRFHFDFHVKISVNDVVIAPSNLVGVLFLLMSTIRGVLVAEKPKETSSKPVSTWNWFRTRCKLSAIMFARLLDFTRVKHAQTSPIRAKMSLIVLHEFRTHSEPRSDATHSVLKVRQKKQGTAEDRHVMQTGAYRFTQNRTSKPNRFTPNGNLSPG
ncbi:hypothetical protein ALC53_07045 [Atta colombica]|uniref:Ant venom allergen Sol i 2/4 domain-containing protein n=1 Tax=Atta colombica TaxID=520822 RepID=A0A195BEB6_9HYME|nr:hypothetical protein ALC53_07045 [Atta colombica]